MFLLTPSGVLTLYVLNITFLRFQFDSHSVHLQILNVCGVLKILVLVPGEICFQNLVLF